MTRPPHRLALWLCAAACAVPAFADVTGSVHLESGPAIAYTFVGLMSPEFSMVGYAIAEPDGAFTIAGSAKGGYLAVQPPAAENDAGLGIYAAQPRLYQLGDASKADIRLPASGCLVLRGHDTEGKLLRWEDYERRGLFGKQFMYATNLEDEAVPAVCWPVYDQAARDQGSPREKGLPALVVPPGQRYVAHVLFWEVPDYGKLHLRADNGGKGYVIKNAGDFCVIDVNLELARTAVADLERRQSAYLADVSLTSQIGRLRQELAKSGDGATDAAAASLRDTILSDALRLRDDLEFETARQSIPLVRKGSLEVRVVGADGKPIPDCEVAITQNTHNFTFGVFEGSPYNAKAFETAREGGFDMATVLLGWNWCDMADGANPADVDYVFGISALNRLGYKVKEHGAVWLQGYGIMPERVKGLEDDALVSEAVAQLNGLLDEYTGPITVWEAMNEPAATNVVGMDQEWIHKLLDESARAIERRNGMLSLVNSGHEVTCGHQYLFFGLDNQPTDSFSKTYLTALKHAEKDGALDDIDVVGIQFYPGFHFNEMFGGLQGPAQTPSWVVDLAERYGQFDKPVHITEFSLPSSYGPSWTSGYWREPWTQTTQADYAERVYTVAFGNPRYESITWWDITDIKPSVLTGGLVDADGRPKEAFKRIRDLIASWTTEATVTTNAEGVAMLSGFGGGYTVTATLPDGGTIEAEAHIRERAAATVTVKAGDGS
ncbi:MAG: hypothetical protein GY851_21960 [bacterium]|nr:hypothetical protein [bacterium]